MIRVDVRRNRLAGVVGRRDPIPAAKAVGELSELRLKLAKRFDQNVEGQHRVKRRSSFGRAHVNDRRRTEILEMRQGADEPAWRSSGRTSAQLEPKFAQSQFREIFHSASP